MRKTEFNEVLFQQAYPPGIENHFWTIARNGLVLDDLKSSGTGGGVILDIGCGKGITVKALRESGFDCFGSDLSPNFGEESPFLFFQADAFTLPEEFRHSVTCVLLLDVLEHFSDPAKFLKDCRKSFPRLQRIIITLPARQELWSNYDEYYGHYQRYSIETARALLIGLGMDRFKIQYFFHSLYLIAYLQKLLLGNREVVLRAPRYIFLHRWMAKFLWMESWILPGRLFGSSIFIAV